MHTFSLSHTQTHTHPRIHTPCLESFHKVGPESRPSRSRGCRHMIATIRPPSTRPSLLLRQWREVLDIALWTPGTASCSSEAPRRRPPLAAGNYLAAEAANHNMKPLTVELHFHHTAPRPPTSEGSVHMAGCSAPVRELARLNCVTSGLTRDSSYPMHTRHRHWRCVLCRCVPTVCCFKRAHILHGARVSGKADVSRRPHEGVRGKSEWICGTFLCKNFIIPRDGGPQESNWCKQCATPKTANEQIIFGRDTGVPQPTPATAFASMPGSAVRPSSSPPPPFLPLPLSLPRHLCQQSPLWQLTSPLSHWILLPDALVSRQPRGHGAPRWKHDSSQAPSIPGSQPSFSDTQNR